MYITITAQKQGANYQQSVGDFVSYLEKENQGKDAESLEHFFNQYGEEISSKEVIYEIDKNTSKLKKTEPKFYSITVNPSSSELRRLQNCSEDLKRYTHELMKNYATSFNRDGVTVDDIKYYAKIEHQRTYKGTDKQIQENQSYASKILLLKNEIRKIETNKLDGNIKKLKREIDRLEKSAPHQQNGKRIVRGMAKEGSQSHIHIIVSRKDINNNFSLSPGSKYKGSQVMMNGKMVKRGFDREKFFTSAEKTYDNLFAYKRNYVETYKGRKTLIQSPVKYFAHILGLPTNQRAIAFKLLAKTGIDTSILHIPRNKAQIASKAIKNLKRGLQKSIQSGSIEI